MSKVIAASVSGWWIILICVVYSRHILTFAIFSMVNKVGMCKWNTRIRILYLGFESIAYVVFVDVSNRVLIDISFATRMIIWVIWKGSISVMLSYRRNTASIISTLCWFN